MNPSFQQNMTKEAVTKLESLSQEIETLRTGAIKAWDNWHPSEGEECLVNRNKKWLYCDIISVQQDNEFGQPGVIVVQLSPQYNDEWIIVDKKQLILDNGITLAK